MKTGFIGLGNLGKALASRLAEQGEDLVLWNRTLKKAEGMKGEAAKTPAEVAEKCDVIFLNLFDTNAVLDVLLDENGLFSAESLKGKIIIDTTTNHYEEVLSVHELCQEADVAYLEAPVLGSVVPALKGLLTVIVSGDETVFNQNKALIGKFGANIYYMGGAGIASKMKVINNMLLGVFMASISESVALAQSAGIDKSVALDILGNGGGKSLVLDAKRQKLIDEDFSPHFSVDAIFKDLGYLQQLAVDNKFPLFTISAVKEMFCKASSLGFGDEDFSAVYKTVKK